MILYTIYGSFLKWWYPQNTPKWSVLVGKPMVVGYHQFRKPPCRVTSIYKLEHNHIIIISYIYICTIYYIVWKIVYIYINHQSPAIDFLQNIAKLLDCQAEAQILLKCRILENRQNSALCKPLHILKALETSLTQKNSLNFNRHQSCRNRFEKHTRSVSHPTCWCQCPLVFLKLCDVSWRMPKLAYEKRPQGVGGSKLLCQHLINKLHLSDRKIRWKIRFSASSLKTNMFQ